jgi:hypothetical protein
MINIIKAVEVNIRERQIKRVRLSVAELLSLSSESDGKLY